MAGNFSFKRFTIEQDRTAMKVGTDGVLLGAWCSVLAGVRRALDIGTGTGVIAIMLAQRSEKRGMEIDAVEVDPHAAGQARDNAAASPWSRRIKVYDMSLQEYREKLEEKEGLYRSGGLSSSVQYPYRSGTPGRYDLIVSNPPYFTDSLLPPDRARTTARHTTMLGRDELVDISSSLLDPGGRFAVVIPFEQSGNMIPACDTHGLQLVRRTDVWPTPFSGPKRSLLEFEKWTDGNATCVEADELIIETSPLAYTDKYKELTKDFYLKF